jgi:hypothetical protein
VEVKVLELPRIEIDRLLAQPSGSLPSKKLSAEMARMLLESPHSKVVHRLDLQSISGQTTHFRVDSRVPTASGSRGDEPSFYEIGIGLDLTPRVFQSREISVKTLSRVRVLRSPDTDGTQTTVFENPPIGNETRIGNGESLLLGGFITELERAMLPPIPALPDNPLLNYLFPGKRDSKERPEIVMVLSPRIVGPLLNAEADAPAPVPISSSSPPALQLPPVAAPSAAAAKPPAAPPVPVQSTGYSVQVGAFESSAKADFLVALLAKKYDSVFIDKVPGKTPFRVRVGRFTNMNQARELQKKIARDGYDTFVTKLD